MSIWNKVFLVLILLASVGLFYLTARALQTHKHWREQARTLEQQLEWERDKQLVWEEGLDSPLVETREQECQKLGSEAGKGILDAKDKLKEQAQEVLEAMGEDAGLMTAAAGMGRRDLEMELYEQLLDRGRVWQRCTEPQVSKQTDDEVSVKTELPDHQIKLKTVLWVFDEAGVEQGGRYLGQFTVDEVGGQEILLKPSMRMTRRQSDTLQKSAARPGATWVLCEVVPVDTHDAFAGLSEDRLKALLPAGSVEDYITDGQLITAEDATTQGLQGKVLRVDENDELVTAEVDGVKDDDGMDVPHTMPAEEEIDTGRGKFVRQLRDYEELFRHYAVQLAVRTEEMQLIARHRDYIDNQKEGVEDLRQHAEDVLKYRQRERDQLLADKKEALRKRDTAAAHLSIVKETLGAIQNAIAETIAANQAMAGEIARIQWEATRLIDERTRTMAQAGVPE